MSNLIFGFIIGFLFRSLLQWRTNYRLGKMIDKISDGMNGAKVNMEKLEKCISDKKELHNG